MRDAETIIHADTGDAAIWTGLYAASEALRYQATQDSSARLRMEKSLWALHALVHASPLPGTAWCAIFDTDGNILETKPQAKIPTLRIFLRRRPRHALRCAQRGFKKALLADVESLGDHLLAHDLSFISPYGISVDLNPYLGAGFMNDAVQDLWQSTKLRRDVIRTLTYARWYFWLHGERPPASFGRLARELKHPNSAELGEPRSFLF